VTAFQWGLTSDIILVTSSKPSVLRRSQLGDRKACGL